MNRLVLPGAVIALIALGGFLYSSGGEVQQAITGAAMVEVTLPAVLSDTATIGKSIFDTTCASCHGENASGQGGVAPPLVHIIYEPNHHGDEAFQRAVAQGVQAHHWSFGNMPAVAGLTRADVAMVVAYVRELQRANDIQ